MAIVTINVSRNGNSTNLKLSDSEGHNPGNDDLTTTVNLNDTVQWVIADSSIASINGVFKTVPTDPSYDADSLSLLTEDPKKNDEGIFTGTVVSSSPGNGKYEKYKIEFMIPNDSTVYSDDPKLQMNA